MVGILLRIIRAALRRIRARITPCESVESILSRGMAERQLGEREPLSAADNALLAQFLERLSARDYQILCLFKEGKKHREIAAAMGTDVDSVRLSLARIYSDMRMWLYGSGPHDPGTDSAPVAKDAA